MTRTDAATTRSPSRDDEWGFDPDAKATDDLHSCVSEVIAWLKNGASLTEDETAIILSALRHNLRTGRAQKFMARLHPDATPHGTCTVVNQLIGCWNAWSAYRNLVLDTYQAERRRILALSHKENAAWEHLANSLARSATAIFCHWGMSYHAAEDRGQDAAQQACAQIYAAIFPCDVPFDCWAYTVLKNVILQTRLRSHDLLDRNPFVKSLDELNETESSVANEPDPGARSDAMTSLLNAIGRMKSANRRQVLIHTYFDDMEDDEIATAMGRSTGVIYTLRHRAVRQLRGYFNDDAADSA